MSRGDLLTVDESINKRCSQEKLTWIFNAFDKDGGGTIDIQEIRQLNYLKIYSILLFMLEQIRCHIYF